MPSDVFGTLKRSIRAGEITWHQTQVDDLTDRFSGGLMHLVSGKDIEVDLVLLATGLDHRRPGGSMVDELVEKASLEFAECGYPVVDHYLRWHPNIYVSGPLAELEIGPVARNIAGARRSADRILGALRGVPPRRVLYG